MFCTRTAILTASLAFSLSAFAQQNVPPQTVGTIPGATLYSKASPKVVDLTKYFTDPDTTGIRLTTVLGKVDLALYDHATPITVANFLKYVDNGRYNITDPVTGEPAPIFFHRSVANFIIQSGGYLATVSSSNPAAIGPTQVDAYPSIMNEPGISNTRGTIAMAKLSGQPNSATSEWFINLADNSSNLDGQNSGFTVFGKVLGNGMSVVDAIAALPVFAFRSPFDTLPLRNYTSDDFSQNKPAGTANAVTIPSITRVPALTYTASSDNAGIATASISGDNLLVSPKAIGTAQITVTGTDIGGATVAQNFSVNVTRNPVHLANISTRVVVGAGDDALIGGFIVRGTAPKRVAIRALGPSLAASSISNFLADPTLELHDGTGKILASNDNWQDSLDKQDIIDVGLAPTKANESVILTTLPATSAGSAYTAVIHGADGTGGTGLVEIYDLDSGPGSNVLNISTRGSVQSGDNVLIGGLIVFGDSNQQVLVRAIGPSLAAAGINDPLSDPTLTLNDAQGNPVDFNDNWQENPSAAEIRATTIPPTDPKESAVLQTLPPGNYTAIVRGAGSSTGTGLVEVYALQSLGRNP